jgi:hypothetical protein
MFLKKIMQNPKCLSVAMACSAICPECGQRVFLTVVFGERADADCVQCPSCDAPAAIDFSHEMKTN